MVEGYHLLSVFNVVVVLRGGNDDESQLLYLKANG